MHATRSLVLMLLIAFGVVLENAPAEEQAARTLLKTETFSADPGWEGHNNRVVPARVPIVTQNFGYSETNFAGGAAGELGGSITRASEPAYYADRIGPLTLDDKLSAAGSFVLTKTTAGGGVFFGFFRVEQPGAGGRPISSLGLDFDCERSGGRLAVRLITGRNQSCGTFVTPFIPGKFRPTPIREGTRYRWTLDYDPQGADGRGRFVFTIQGDAPQPGEFSNAEIPESHKQEARRRFPDATVFTVDLPEGYREQGTTFDHFGVMNMMKPGGRTSIYVDDLHYLGRTQDFSHDPKWDASGNRTTYQAKDVGGAHDFGFRATSYAGGEPGEVGGTFWRSGKYGYYADRVGPLTLDDRLAASGNVVLKSGGPDSDMFLGWFNSANQDQPPTEAGNFLGVHVGGPTRVGHYFHPSLATGKGARQQSAAGPVLTPGKPYDWSLVYDPAAENGNGAITVTLGEESVTLTLKKEMKAQNAGFDRFGLFTSNIGGQMVKIYLDDLKYTAARRSTALAASADDNRLADEKPSAPRAQFVEIPEQGKVRFENGPRSDRVPEHFRLEPHEFTFRVRAGRTGQFFRVLGLKYPSPVTTDVAENNTVHAEYFQPSGPGPFPACVVLHILGGDFLLAETVAAHLARQGVAALFVKMPYYGPRRGKDSARRMISEDPRATVAGMTQAVLDVRRAVAWLAAREEVDPQRLGITGISLGGIMSALSAAGEPRLKNVAVVLGGGNFAEFIWKHQLPRARTFRERWLAAGESEASFRELIGKVDPVTYGDLLKGRRVLMIAASQDEVISPESAKALWESIGREPELVWLEDAGHYSAIKYLPRELYRLSAFFNGPVPTGKSAHDSDE